MDGGEPDIPIYKVIECIGPTNTRVYTVAVYFRGKRLASSTGHSIQQAEMKSAKAALENSSELFPQLDYQKRVIAQSIKRQKGKEYAASTDETYQAIRRSVNNPLDDESNLPKQYRTREDISSDEMNILSSDSDEGRVRRKRRKRKKKSKKQSKKDDHDKNLFSPLSDDSQINGGFLLKEEYNQQIIYEETTVSVSVTVSNTTSLRMSNDILENVTDSDSDCTELGNNVTQNTENVLSNKSSLESGETD